jgi:hypothetical protein
MMADFDRFHFGHVTVIEAQLPERHLTDEWRALAQYNALINSESG